MRLNVACNTHICVICIRTPSVGIFGIIDTNNNFSRITGMISNEEEEVEEIRYKYTL